MILGFVHARTGYGTVFVTIAINSELVVSSRSRNATALKNGHRASYSPLVRKNGRRQTEAPVEISRKAEGRWYGILTQLGVDPVFLRNRNGPCPACAGTDRFRFDDLEGKGTFYCNGGGNPLAGDGFGLVKHLHECDFPAAARMVEEALGGKHQNFTPVTPAVKRSTKSANTSTLKYAQDIWERTQPDALVCHDKPVAAHPYAVRKQIKHACGAARGTVTGRLIGNGADCIIVPMRTLTGELTGVECINGDGVKQTFGSKGVLLLGNTLDKSLPIYVVEGWADGAAAWRYYGNVAIVVTFGKGKQEPFARALDAARPDREIIIVRDAA